jgi:hypothetical protein
VGRTVLGAPKKATGGTMKLEIYPWVIDGSLNYNDCLPVCLPGCLYVCIATDKYLEHHLEKNLKTVTAGMF